MQKPFLLTLLFCLIAAIQSNAQFIYKIKADSVKITNDSCSAELIVENSTKAIPGFLFNNGNGRTVFKKVMNKLNDTTYVIGGDTLRLGYGAVPVNAIINQFSAAQPSSRFWVSLPSRLDSNLTIMGKLMIGTTTIDSGFKARIAGGDMMIGTARLGNGRAGQVSNIAFGQSALQSNTSGGLNVAIGHLALKETTTGYANTGVGSYSLQDNTTGIGNSGLGYISLQLNTTGSQNTAIGGQTLAKNLTGSSNTAIGYASLQKNTTGSSNTAAGVLSLGENTTGHSNVATGISALEKNTTGAMNTSAGAYSLRLTTTGSSNTAVGNYAGYYNTTGFGNTALGSYALFANDTGRNNVGIGFNSAYSAVQANANVSIGTNSLYSNVSGSNNIAVGHYSGSSLNGGNNNIIIGYNVQPAISTSGSNQLNIGNWIYGDNGKIGIGVTAPSGRLHVAAGNFAAAPLVIAQGTNTTTPVNGAIEYNGSNYFASAGDTRYTLAKTLSITSSLDFPNTAASSSSELTITLNGAAEGDVVSLGIPNAAIVPNSSYMAWISAANTVTIRFSNNDAANSQNPASGTFRISLTKY